MIKRTLLLSLVIISLSAFSQDAGYIITKSADTLYGGITNETNFFIISKPGVEDKLVPVREIKYVNAGKMKGTIFQGAFIPYTAELDKNSIRETGKKVFKVLILSAIYKTPKMTLFEVYDKNKTVYYFVQRPEDDVPIQMIVSYYINSYHDQKVPIYLAQVSQVQVKSYIEQLKDLMSDCDIPEKEWDAMDYRSYSFKRIIKLYNRCN